MELKPCPFYGGEVKARQREHTFYGEKPIRTDLFWTCECDHMSFHRHYKYPAIGERTMPIFVNRDAAEGYWNKYAERTAKRLNRERRRCSCGKVVPESANYCPNCGAKVVKE